jgi:omega-6 fatty acid desaturase (delta-12 desaturase)
MFLGAFLFPEPWMRGLAVILQPMVIGGLFVVGHDAAHHSLVPQGWLNRLLGRLAMLPAWHPFTAWSFSHNTLHHGGTNLRGRHPDFVPMTKAEYDACPRYRRALERIYRSAWGVGWSYVFDFYLRYLVLPRGERRPPANVAYQLDRVLIVAFLAAQSIAGWQLSLHTPGRMLSLGAQVALVVVVPWVSWIWFIGFMSYIQHTHPKIAWYDDREEWSYYHVQLKSTTHVRFPWPIEPLLNNITDHAAHHLDPTIPLYHLAACQERLEESCPEHAVVVDWSLLGYLETCRVCKLYDFERHCWMDFAGNRTSEMDLPNLPWK